MCIKLNIVTIHLNNFDYLNLNLGTEFYMGHTYYDHIVY